MRITSGDKTIYIDDRFISYSPYLSVIRDTDVGVDRDEEGAIILAEPMSSIIEYINFLQGKDFSMDEDVASFFEFMGHSNNMEYPIDYWKIKLQDNWIRDNFYKLGLVNDPYYDLVEIDKVRDIASIDIDEPYLFVAGGAAMYMAGYIDDINDVDIFTIDQDKAITWFNDRYGFTIEGSRVITSLRYHVHAPIKHQVIKRVYRSPSEIVHGFDLDCVGVIYDGEKLWATRRAIWSNENRINWFDPRRMSPSYVHRLNKYMMRGFSINVPFIDQIDINQYEAARVWRSMWKAGTYKYIVDDTVMDGYGLTHPLPIPKTMSDISNYSEVIANNNILDKYRNRMNYRTGYIFAARLRGLDIIYDEDELLPDVNRFFHPLYLEHDQASILLLAINYGFYANANIDTSDYEMDVGENSGSMGYIGKVNRSSPWLTIDPMQQLTGTFDPSSIETADAFISWLRSSPLAN